MPQPAGRHIPLAFLLAVITDLAMLLFVASIGAPEDLTSGRPLDAVTCAIIAVTNGGAPLLAGAIFLIAAHGLGSLARPLLRETSFPFSVQSALGLAILLTIAHVLGQTGVLTGRLGMVLAWVVLASGIVLSILEIAKIARPASADPAPRRAALSILAHTLARAIAVPIFLVFVAHPPGSLWDSEFGGFDALSYHLQLPQEWLVRGRIEPLTHNVYSFLPSYFESAFHFLGVATGAPTQPQFPGGPIGLLAGTGWRANACQGLHAAMAIEAAYLIAALAMSLAGAAQRRSATGGSNSGAPSPAELPSGWTTWCPPPLLALLFLLTPWVVVTGTLAYNEMPMLALSAGAMLAAADQRLSPARRGLLSGILIGAACGVKPTALLFGAVPTGVLLLGTLPLRSWWRAVLPGAAAGFITLLPWMIRNQLAAGNPLFPFALTGVLGTAHWNAEQVTRFAGEHFSHEPLLQKLRLLVLADSTDPAGPRHRGMLHPQWGAFFPLTILSAAHAVFWLRGTLRRHAVLLTLGFAAQLGAWLFASHLQSRFLLPLIVTGIPLVALAWMEPKPVDAGPRALRRVSLVGVRAMIALAVLAQGGFLLKTISNQRDGKVNSLLPFTPSDFTATAIHNASPENRDLMVSASPAMGVAALVPPAASVYLLGDAAPFYYPPNVRYNTTWDTWPFDAGTFTIDGIDYVLVDLASIERYVRSGYAPPGVSVDAVRDWMTRETTPVRTWPTQERALVKRR